MSYGAGGPPKGYSQTMAKGSATGDGGRKCQTCGSSVHFTYECTTTAADVALAKVAKPAMSRAQQIRLGLKKLLKVKPVAPPLTAEEAFKKTVLEKAKQDEAELRAALAAQEELTGEEEGQEEVKEDDQNLEADCNKKEEGDEAQDGAQIKIKEEKEQTEQPVAAISRQKRVREGEEEEGNQERAYEKF